MKQSELQSIIRGITPVLQGYIDKQLARIEGRLDEFKAPERGPRGEPGRPGPPGEKGEPGKDGESVDMEAVQKQVQEFLESIPLPENGKDAEPVDMEAVKAQVQEYLDAIPMPEDGKDGKDGEDGKSVTIDDVKPMLDTALARWALDFERLANEKLERAILSMPKPKDGVDGMGFDDLEVEYDGERTFTFKLVRGERVKTHSFVVPVILDRGVYSESTEYSKGDCTSYGGSMWIAQTDKPDGAPGKTKDWRLSAKKGRDGKDGRDGIDKTAPVKGKKGDE